MTGVAVKIYELTLVNYTITSILARTVLFESLRNPGGSVTFRTGNLALDWASLVAQMVKNLPAGNRDQGPGSHMVGCIVKDKAWDGKLPLTVTDTLHSVARCFIVFHRHCFSFLCSFSLPN